jgi:hypothetical protein
VGGLLSNYKGGDAPPCDQELCLPRMAFVTRRPNRLVWRNLWLDRARGDSTDMGSGAFANTCWRMPYFRNMLYVWAPATAWWFESGSISRTDNACYTADGPFYSSDPNWRNWFYYGGPGKEARGCH